jgi:molybdopterin molybdotransferase
MTGGIVPEGADTVVMIEHTGLKDGHVVVHTESGDRNICYRAEDIHKGDTVLQKGTLINPAEVAVLASVGCDPAPVARRPVLGIIATGSELVEPSVMPGVAQIRNSNSYQLVSQAQRAGCVPVYLGIIEDSPHATAEAIDRSVSQVDVLLLSGGVSMGEFDYVPGVLKEKGFELLFEKMAIKPGKPTVFGRKGSTFVFGMPGNPVSTFILFEILVKPFCYKLMGADYSPLKMRATLTDTIKRKKTERLSFLPVVLRENGEAGLVKYHGSAHIHALTKANAVVSIPIGVNEIKAGEKIDVRVIT